MDSWRESKGRRPQSRLAAGLCLVLLAGCGSSLGRSGFDRDPLTGGGPPIPRDAPAAQAPAVASATAAAAAPAANPLPSLPAPASTTSPAALSGGAANPSLDPGRDLRIGAGLGAQAPPPASNNWNNSQASAVLRTPQPVNDATLQQTGSQALAVNAAGAALTAGARADAYQQLQDALNARGVTWRRLETLGDTSEWKFSCSVPNPKQPGIRQHYESRGASDLNAIRAVIDQIDRARQSPG